MPQLLVDLPWLETAIVWGAVAAAGAAAIALLVEREGTALFDAYQRRVNARYTSLITGALAGDAAAAQRLQASPPRHRVAIARLVILPLVDDRDSTRIARSRLLMRSLGLPTLARRFLQSRHWWRRATALRALGLLQETDYTAAIVAALDDVHPDVRGAALDALADLRDPLALSAIVVRLHDETLHLGRRIEALTAFRAAAEPMLLDLAAIDAMHSTSYAMALGLCGTSRSRALLCRWALDDRADLSAAAIAALQRIGLDREALDVVVRALEHDAEIVRTAAAAALHGWKSDPQVAAKLGLRLGDSWTVAARAAHSLRSMGSVGVAELAARAGEPGLAGVLAQQMLWEHSRR